MSRQQIDVFLIPFPDRAVLLNIPGFVIVGILACLGGVIAFAYYAKINCDPMTGGIITNPNQVHGPSLILDPLLNARTSHRGIIP